MKVEYKKNDNPRSPTQWPRLAISKASGLTYVQFESGGLWWCLDEQRRPLWFSDAGKLTYVSPGATVTLTQE